MMHGEAVEQEFERLRQGFQGVVHRVVELERVTAQGTTRERELITRVDELTRAVVRQQGHGRDRVKEISEKKAKLWRDWASWGMTERHAKSGTRNL